MDMQFLISPVKLRKCGQHARVFEIAKSGLLFLGKPVESDAYNDTIQNIEALQAPAP